MASLQQFFTDEGGVVRPIRAALGSAYRKSIETRRRKLTGRLAGPRGPLRALPIGTPAGRHSSARTRAEQLRAEGERLAHDAEESLARSGDVTGGSLESVFGITRIPDGAVKRWRRAWSKLGSSVRPKSKLSQRDSARIWLAYKRDFPDAQAGDGWWEDIHPDVYDAAMNDHEIARKAEYFVTRGASQAKRGMARARALLGSADRLERVLDPAGRLKRIERELDDYYRRIDEGRAEDPAREETLLRQLAGARSRVKIGRHGRALQRVSNPSGGWGWLAELGAIAAGLGLAEWALRRTGRAR